MESLLYALSWGAIAVAVFSGTALVGKLLIWPVRRLRARRQSTGG